MISDSRSRAPALVFPWLCWSLFSLTVGARPLALDHGMRKRMPHMSSTTDVSPWPQTSATTNTCSHRGRREGVQRVLRRQTLSFASTLARHEHFPDVTACECPPCFEAATAISCGGKIPLRLSPASAPCACWRSPAPLPRSPRAAPLLQVPASEFQPCSRTPPLPRPSARTLPAPRPRLLPCTHSNKLANIRTQSPDGINLSKRLLQ